MARTHTPTVRNSILIHQRRILGAVFASHILANTFIFAEPRVHECLAQPYKIIFRNKNINFVPVTSNIESSSATDEERQLLHRTISSDGKCIVSYFGFPFHHKVLKTYFGSAIQQNTTYNSSALSTVVAFWKVSQQLHQLSI